jgi:signal transduction histidine kinase/ligand-binding sensor domain-containing protein
MEADGSFRRFMHDPADTTTLNNNKVIAIFEDSRGIFWVGTGGDGLHTLDRKTGRVNRHRYNPARPDALSRPPLENDRFQRTNSIITNIWEDRLGSIWIGTIYSALSRYDTALKKMTRYKGSNGYPDSTNWTSFVSADGTIWLASEGTRLYRTDPYVKNVPHISATDQGICFLDAGDGTYWVGSFGGGLMHFDQQDKLIRQYRHDPLDPYSLIDERNNVLSLFQDHPDYLWIGTSRGLGLFDLRTGRFSRPDFPNSLDSGLSTRAILYMVKDKAGIYWISLAGDGILRYDAELKSSRHYRHDPKDSTSLSSNTIPGLLADSSGTVWCADQVLGDINRLDAKTGKFHRYLISLKINSLMQDAEGTIWAGTMQGLYRYNPVKDIFAPFFDPHAIYSSANTVSLTEDHQKIIWARTFSGLIRINPRSGSCIVYSSNIGLEESVMTIGTIQADKKNRILLTSTQKGGFYAFSPESLDTAGIPFRILVSGLEINDKLQSPSKNGLLTGSLEETGNLTLPYDRNSLSFNFSSTDYREPESVRYYVQLENYDNTWRETTAEKSAHFFFIPDGRYVFRIKAYNKNGQMAERTIQIRITPPWWKTSWAYTLYGLLLISLLYLADRVQKQRIIRRERQKAQVIELAQAKEIEKAYHELRATQAQLLHAEKMASLGELTAGIAHEIQNPLNFVNNFSELNDELSDETLEAANKGDLEEVRQLVARIKSNQQKIQIHGKRADSIVKSMLQHSRTGPAQKELTDINALCEECLRLAYHGMRAKDKTFQATYDLHADLAVPKINIVTQEIARTLLNLANNAFQAVQEKAAHAGTGYQPAVTISTALHDGRVEIRVEDNGAGIPEASRQKIFQPFFTTKPSGQGTGLGLSLSNDLVRANGGVLSLEKSDEQGSRFLVSLPATGV